MLKYNSNVGIVRILWYLYVCCYIFALVLTCFLLTKCRTIRNKCCEFLASYGVIIQSVTQAFFDFPYLRVNNNFSWWRYKLNYVKALKRNLKKIITKIKSYIKKYQNKIFASKKNYSRKFKGKINKLNVKEKFEQLFCSLFMIFFYVDMNDFRRLRP